MESGTGTPICSVCTRDWDDRLGYCEHCEQQNDNTPHLRLVPPPSTATDHHQLTLFDIPGWRNTAGMLEDNFS